MKKLLLITVLLLSGCVVFPKEQMIQGSSMAEIKKTFGDVDPRASRTFPAPHSPQESMTSIEYSVKPSGCQNCSAEPHWILFYQDKLVAFDIGTAQDAEYRAYKSYFRTLLDKKEITYTDETRMLQSKFMEIFNNGAEVMDFARLFFSYRMMLAGKVDKGEMDYIEADYLVAQRQYEFNESIRQMDAQRKRAFWAAIGQLGQDLRDRSEREADRRNMMIQQNKGIHCESRKIGGGISTDCY